MISEPLNARSRSVRARRPAASGEWFGRMIRARCRGMSQRGVIDCRRHSGCRPAPRPRTRMLSRLCGGGLSKRFPDGLDRGGRPPDVSVGRPEWSRPGWVVKADSTPRNGFTDGNSRRAWSVDRGDLRIRGMIEVVLAFAGRDGVVKLAVAWTEVVDRAFACLSGAGPERCEGEFDGIEIGRIRSGKTSCATRASMKWRASAPLWLSRMTMSPGDSVERTA